MVPALCKSWLQCSRRQRSYTPLLTVVQVWQVWQVWDVKLQGRHPAAGARCRPQREPRLLRLRLLLLQLRRPLGARGVRAVGAITV